MSKFIFSFLFLVFTTSLSSAADDEVFVPGEVTMIGTFVMAKGEDKDEHLVSYRALKLAKSASIKVDNQLFENIQYLKLWLDKMPPDTFSKNRGVLLKVTGVVDYYWFGPSTFINPAKIQVNKVEQLNAKKRSSK